MWLCIDLCVCLTCFLTSPISKLNNHQLKVGNQLLIKPHHCRRLQALQVRLNPVKNFFGFTSSHRQQVRLPRMRLRWSALSSFNDMDFFTSNSESSPSRSSSSFDNLSVSVGHTYCGTGKRLRWSALIFFMDLALESSPSRSSSSFDK